MSSGICRYLPVFASISVQLRHFPAARTLGSERLQPAKQTEARSMLEKQARQQIAKKRKRYAKFSDTDRAEIGQYAAIIVTTHLLVKIERGAKMGTAPAFVKIRSQITQISLKMAKLQRFLTRKT